jgi:KUP system potassium uptake protein
MAAKRRWVRRLLIPLGIFGAALLYGDGTITPAISVLSAIEGLVVVNEGTAMWVLPLTVGILFALFVLQHKGTQSIGTVFGPIMLLWFLVIAVLGVRGIMLNPSVLGAINPMHALGFLAENRLGGLLVLGTVFLVVTGAEALYADLGHFGLGPIRTAWFALVLPSLVLNYFGQGALILKDPVEAAHPFFHLAPEWSRYLLIGLASVATIIASQAVISGTFSLTAQAIRLDLLPRMNIVHTSADERGQIYIPFVNWALMFATIGLVIGFNSSTRLGAAYGLAVSADMVITTLLAGVIAYRHGGRPVLVMTIAAGLWLVDWSFLVANLFKFMAGGWYPVLVGCLVFTIVTTWQRGRELLKRRLDLVRQPLSSFFASPRATDAMRLPGTAVFLTRPSKTIPPTLLHHLEHHQVLHEQVILLGIEQVGQPRVAARDRLVVDTLPAGFARLTVRYGYLQSVNVPTALRLAEHAGLIVDTSRVTYYIGRETLIPTDDVGGMALWRERLFAFLSRNALRTAVYYGIPVEQVVELGIEIEI